MQRVLINTLIAALLLAAPGRADAQSLDRATHRGVSIDDVVAELAKHATSLRPREASASPSSTPQITWLIDVSYALIRARVLEDLAASLTKRFDGVVARHDVWQVGRTAPGASGVVQPDRVGKAVTALLKTPEQAAQDVMRAVARAARRPSAARSRSVVLITLSNADTESAIETTREGLRKSGVRLLVATTPARYSDSYWVQRAKKAREQGVRLAGAESPRIEFPWGYLTQRVDPHGEVSSGYAPYGMNRLALGSGGSVFLLASREPERKRARWRLTFCKRVSCALCDGEHECGTAYSPRLLARYEPDSGSRASYTALVRDSPAARTLGQVWDACHRLGVVGGPPPRPAGETDDVKALSGRTFPWQPSRLASLARGAKALRAGLAEQIDRLASVARDQNTPTARRAVAAADALRAVLLVIRFNLDQLERFAERSEGIKHMKPRTALERALGVVHRCQHKACAPGPWQVEADTVPLCHGISPLRNVRWLGGKAADAEMGALCDAVGPLLVRYRNTPWELVIRRATVLRLRLARKFNCHKLGGSGGGGGPTTNKGPRPRPERTPPRDRTRRDETERTDR